jgi:hypothetical protein
VAAVLLFSAGLAFVSSNFQSLAGFLSFLVVLALCAGLIWLTWRTLRAEKPPAWLLWVTLGAIVFRLVLAVVWFVALPAGGYDTDVQNAGYVMEDAFNRDRAALDLARSDQPLISSFQGLSSTDQYGGLLFLSAFVYRYLSPAIHQPLLVAVLAATVSGLAVAFTWAVARRLWGDRVAWLAAWALALYPEAALLGSSQMREAFMVCLVPLSLLGLQRVFKKQPGWGLLAVAFGAALFFSWPFVSSLLILLALAYLAETKWALLRDLRFWFAALAVLVLGLAYVFLVKDAAQLWLVQSARWQAYVSANASGWVARQFERMPLWAQLPYLMVYGIFRPLLPAALAAGGPPIWVAIGIWRALGWTALLAFLVYASYLALRSGAWKRWPGALLAASWIVTLTASYRGGGDLWDSPRYRSAFAAVHVALAAWAWVEHRQTKDPWLRRTAVSLGLMLLWFVPWYLRRYTAFTWPIVEIYQVIGVSLVTIALYIAWDWVGGAKPAKPR